MYFALLLVVMHADDHVMLVVVGSQLLRPVPVLDILALP
jgi:hypothetical protein